MAEIADYVQGGNTVIFTRNGYMCMVTMSFDAYKHLNDPVIDELNRVDALCESDPRHYTIAQSLEVPKKRRNARKKFTLDIRLTFIDELDRAATYIEQNLKGRRATP